MLAVILWEVLQVIESTCQFRTELNGLLAECYAPAARNAVGIFALIFVADIVRCTVILRRNSGVERAS